jgi:hypothetical protein
VAHYFGDWAAGRWHGHGVTVDREGRIFEGAFRAGCRAGWGRLLLMSGHSVEGAWAGCRLREGRATVRVARPDGALELGEVDLGRGAVLLPANTTNPALLPACQAADYDDMLERVVAAVRGHILSGRIANVEVEGVGLVKVSLAGEPPRPQLPAGEGKAREATSGWRGRRRLPVVEKAVLVGARERQR